MKKIKLFLILFMLFIPIVVKADHIYSIDMDIHIEKDGTANITEVWDVKADSGSEWYKTMYDLGESKISDFVVYMDGDKLSYRDHWNVDASLSEKAHLYGINKNYDGLELCFGKSDMKRHKFTLKYTLSNYIFNTSDSQVLYWTLIPKITVDYFTVDITSYYKFPDTLDVWGYGYKGYAYVKDGKISMSEDRSLRDDYVVLLAKFPLNTFDTSYKIDEFKSFNDVYNMAQEGSFEYEYDYNTDNNIDVFSWVKILFVFLVFIFIFFKSYSIKTENKYGYVDNKKINKKEVPMFRDIPCNKDIYYANILIKLNDFGYNKFNILGAIILKWVRSGIITFQNKKIGIFNRETSVIHINTNPLFDNHIERSIFEMMLYASNDRILEAKELEILAKENYEVFLDIFDTIEENEINYLKSKLHIYNRIYRKECKYRNIMDDKIYNDSVELYGLKKYLEEFSKIDTKEVMEVKLWDEYLMFAYLFGIADKVANQLKDMYPEIMIQNNIDYETIEFIDRISDRSGDSAYEGKRIDERREAMRNAARTAAENYSSGGGGFSRGGGGGGSRGGGSRGSAGGR